MNAEPSNSDFLGNMDSKSIHKETTAKEENQIKVAVVGCSHGCFDEMYESIRYINENHCGEKNKIRLLLCCGDFQCLRNETDMNCLACPPKYRQMGPFHQYYSGEKKAPVLTIFIGGNHEASNYLQELHYGGWVAPNMFYLGTTGVISVGGIRIAGVSGIYKQQDYCNGHNERYPYDNSSMRSVYHVRECDVYQMGLIKNPIDVFLSHDWPRGIEKYGKIDQLLYKKSFLRQEIQDNTLGNPATEYLLHKLKPSYWFSAHLHVKYAAIVKHAENNEKKSMTKFLALDKCLPQRDFLQILSIPTNYMIDSSEDLKIELDVEWLTILRATHHLVSSCKYPEPAPLYDLEIRQEDKDWVANQLKNLEWPWPFVRTSCIYPQNIYQPNPIGNPQTDGLLNLLQLPHVLTVPYTTTTTTNSEHVENIMREEIIEKNEEQIVLNPVIQKEDDPNSIDIDDI